jgi:hypothetical protein
VAWLKRLLKPEHVSHSRKTINMSQIKQGKFEFPNAISVQMLNVNTRKELHGEEHVQAVDLSFKADFPNTVLDDIFCPGLREAFYFNAAGDAGQERIEGVPETMPNLRFSKLNGQRYTWGGKDKLVGYVLRLEFGLGDSTSNIELELCKVSGRVFEVKEGGTVTVYWKVQNASDRLDLETCGKLVLLGGDEVTMSLVAPTVYQEEKVKDIEHPFIDPDPKPLDGQAGDGNDGQGSWPFPKTPEEALAGATTEDA